MSFGDWAPNEIGRNILKSREYWSLYSGPAQLFINGTVRYDQAPLTRGGVAAPPTLERLLKKCSKVRTKTYYFT
jgi:hypothetical protein